MNHDATFRGTWLLVGLIFYSLNVIAEMIPASLVTNYKTNAAWTLPGNPEIMEKTWQDVCKKIALPPTDIHDGWWCINPAGNPIYIQSGDICADGSFRIPMNSDWCNEPVASCPNPSWVLSKDKATCFRPDDACWRNINYTNELKLLAAIAYGESHWSNVYEEMAGIASAAIRRRDAAGFNSINELVKRNPNFSYAVYDGNERFIKLMCGDEKNFKTAYDAAKNALNYGKDYANGGCFWDGYDLKTSGVKHPKYQQGFRYDNPSHNIFSTPEPLHTPIKGRYGYYDNTYVSTAAQGRTIFWKLDKQFLDANGALQCR